MAQPYEPNPIDTSHVALSPELTALTEKLAENTHEIWAKQRLDENWTFGAQRDDIAKTHPCLVAYSELTEVEKEYDRIIAMETLRLIIALGFSVRPDLH